jgi:hypothetical protein
MLHRNGTPPAPDAVRGRSAPSAARTEFLPDRPIDTPRALAYHLSRQQLAGFPLMRWLYGLLIVVSLLVLLQRDLGLWSAALLVLMLVVLWIWQRSLRSSEYVRFTPQPLPQAADQAEPWPLEPAAKLPVYVSGLLSVDTKVRRFAALPGFYRTFATREHALLCQARPRRFGGLATWPEEEEGLWYAFFYARHVRHLQTGEITFDRARFQGLRIEYEPDKPLDGKSKRRYHRITLYIAFPQAADCQAALADLMVEPIPALQAQSSER